jgi:hypothetical protein
MIGSLVFFHNDTTTSFVVPSEFESESMESKGNRCALAGSPHEFTDIPSLFPNQEQQIQIATLPQGSLPNQSGDFLITF